MRLLLAFLLFAATPALIAQCWHGLDLSSLSGQQGAQKAIEYFNTHYAHSDSTEAFDALEILMHHAQTEGKPQLEVAALGLKGGFFQVHFFNQYVKAGRYFEHAMLVAQSNELRREQFVYQHKLGYVQCQAENYVLGLRNVLYAEEGIKSIGIEKFPEYDVILYDRAKVYIDFGYYQKAEEYLKEALLVTKSERMRQRIFNAFGIVYTEWGKKQKSVESLTKMLESADKNLDSLAIAAGSINLGIAYLNNNEVEAARPLLEKAYALGLALHHKQTQFVCMQVLADLAVQEKRLDEADSILTRLFTMFKRYKVKDLDDWKGYFQTKAQWHREMDNFKEQGLYQDSLLAVQDSIYHTRQTSHLLNIETQLMSERYAMDIQLLKEEEKWQRRLREIITGLAIFLLTLFFIWFYRIRRNYRRKRARLEEEKQDAVERLNGLKKRVRMNNRIIEELKNQQDEDIQLEKGRKPDQKIIDRLHQTVILTEEDWFEFKKLFEKAYPKFLHKFHLAYPDLTEAELRLLALIKLNLSANEMASMLGILPQSVRKTRQRLMKKLDLKEAKALPSFLETF